MPLFDKVIIVAYPIQASGGDIRALDLYKLIRDHTDEKALIFPACTPDIPYLNRHLGKYDFISDLRGIGNSVIVTSIYHPDLMSINLRTNRLIFCAVNNVASEQDVMMMRMANAITVNSAFSAMNLAPSLMSISCRSPIYRMHSWVDPHKFSYHEKARGNVMVIGRHSRPVPSKFGMENAALLGIKWPYEFRMLGGNDAAIKAIGVQAPENWKTYEHNSIDVVEFLRQLDVFLYVVGSMREAWGRSVCEAMLTGIPVICKNRDAIPEYVIDGYNGILISSKDDLVAALESLRDIDRAATMSVNGRRTMEAMMDPRRYAAGVMRIFTGTELPFMPNAVAPYGRDVWVVELGERKLEPSKSYRHLHLSDTTAEGIVRALQFLHGKQFDEAIVFGFDGIPDDRVGMAARTMGQCRRRISICTDQRIDSIPTISHAEGLKRLEMVNNIYL